ncbi:hypothetical protein JV46_25780 [Solemya velum gill symbiont]|uniref:Uncharacterized protein n=1 Tax=Solemya velum gill symbiont TaxID=2340 RepID=A0A0B0HAU0_SOVGS|nr:hypothetical protein JV46_25780 [Solemya velum gill symbiont]
MNDSRTFFQSDATGFANMYKRLHNLGLRRIFEVWRADDTFAGIQGPMWRNFHRNIYKNFYFHKVD